MPLVNIPGVDKPVNFPEGMPPEAITQAIEHDILPGLQPRVPLVGAGPDVPASPIEELGKRGVGGGFIKGAMLPFDLMQAAGPLVGKVTAKATAGEQPSVAAQKALGVPNPESQTGRYVKEGVAGGVGSVYFPGYMGPKIAGGIGSGLGGEAGEHIAPDMPYSKITGAILGSLLGYPVLQAGKVAKTALGGESTILPKVIAEHAGKIPDGQWDSATKLIMEANKRDIPLSAAEALPANNPLLGLQEKVSRADKTGGSMTDRAVDQVTKAIAAARGWVEKQGSRLDPPEAAHLLQQGAAWAANGPGANIERRSLTGQVAGQGLKSDLPAQTTRLTNLLNSDKIGAQSILELQRHVTSVDPNAFTPMVRTLLEGRLEKALARSADGHIASTAPTAIAETLAGAPGQTMKMENFRALVAATARAHGKNPAEMAEAVKGAETLVEILRAAGRGKAGLGAATETSSPVGEAIRAMAGAALYRPQITAPIARFWSNLTETGSNKQIAELLTSKDGIGKLRELAKFKLGEYRASTVSGMAAGQATNQTGDQ